MNWLIPPTRRAASLCFCLVLGVMPLVAQAGRLAIFRIDPLGVEPQIVARLEGVLRVEIGRLADATLPTPAQIRRLMAKDSKLNECTGSIGCLVRAGRFLDVDQIISGNVGGLGDSYVVNLKLVDVKTESELKQIQEPISGSPDQLIETVRVAAYSLLAPDRLRGSIALLTDRSAARVYLNGALIGKTPLPKIHHVKVGDYVLRVTKSGYTDVVQPVKVRFQKTAQVVVKLQAPVRLNRKKQTAIGSKRARPWYTRWWVWTAAAVVAAGAGVWIGYALAPEASGINCNAEPTRCGLPE